MATQKTFLGGDDVQAIVVDCGSWATRLGYSGDDSPRSIIPSAVGIPYPRPANPTSTTVPKSDADVVMAESVASTIPSALTTPPPTAGDLLLSAPNLFRDIQPIYTHDLHTGDASISSWDHMIAVWRSAYSNLRIDPSTAPLMIVEPTRMWRNKDRAAALERAFEQLSVPAAYVARGSAMSAFAAARISACVLDVGAQGATAVPVLDGYALHNATQRGVVGGALLSERLLEWTETYLENLPDYDGNERGPGKRMRGDQGRKDQLVRAAHEIKRDRILGDDKVRRYKVVDLTAQTTKDYTMGHRQFYRLRVMDEFKAGTMQVEQSRELEVSSGGTTTGGKDADKSASMNGNGATKGKVKVSGTGSDGATRSEEKEDKGKGGTGSGGSNGSGERSGEYTLPDGNVVCLDERNGGEIAELLFNEMEGGGMRSLTELVCSCIGGCDVDLRRDLWGGVVVAGGSTLMGGVVERMSRDLALKTPQAYKLKVVAAPNVTERCNGAWIGGSIVSSLGTFHQAWVSKAEYDELGAVGALRKCP